MLAAAVVWQAGRRGQRGEERFLNAGVSVLTSQLPTALTLHADSQLLLAGTDDGSIAVLGVPG